MDSFPPCHNENVSTTHGLHDSQTLAHIHGHIHPKAQQKRRDRDTIMLP